MLANVYYYRREANNDDTLHKYAADLPYERLDKALFRRGTLIPSLRVLILVLLVGFGPAEKPGPSISSVHNTTPRPSVGTTTTISGDLGIVSASHYLRRCSPWPS
jgi:hypothetical protein